VSLCISFLAIEIAETFADVLRKPYFCSMNNDLTSSVLQLACEPLPVVRIAFIGLGKRGISTLKRYAGMEDVRIVALCELRKENIVTAQDVLREAHLPQADCYTDAEGWRRMCCREDIDVVFICTDWLTHTPMAVYAMRQGRHVAIEVPAAMSVDECWQLVDTAEETRRHCFMLENCCYDPFALFTLTLERQGLLGEIVHTEGAYIHDLRSVYFADESEGGYHNNWVKRYNLEHTGNPYPTHGLGPACQLLHIHRGDRLDYLVSMSSLQAGMTAYAREHLGIDSAEAEHDCKLGDVNTTLIRTRKGKTIMLQHAIASPRPYSRLQTVCGTKGFAQKYPVPCVSFDPDGSKSVTGEALDTLMQRYKHPFTSTFGDESRRKGVDNEMNYVMDHRLIYCLHHGLPLDIDVYDAAEWSCITQLSEQSVLAGSKPVEIPDFTRGRWEKT
jgi:predicted dehydrogenase